MKRTYKSHAEEIAAVLAGEGPESAEEMAVEDTRVVGYTCWDCGVTFAPSLPNQRECVRCYVERKL